MNKEQKEQMYRQVIRQVNAVLEDVNDEIAMMSSICCLTSQAFDYYYWTGFYRVYQPGKLIVGPYQGTLGCLYIDFGKGVCGTCAQKQKTVVVADVHQFDGHIACDSASNAEIVVPVFNRKNELIAVFDVDSTVFSSFDETDQRYLEEMLTIFRRI